MSSPGNINSPNTDNPFQKQSVHDQQQKPARNPDHSIKSLIPLLPSTFETIDFAMFDFLNDRLNIYCNTNKGWKKVPIFWAGKERWKQQKENPDIKDLQNSLIYPLMSIEKGTPEKSIESKGKFYANIRSINDYKGGAIKIAARIQQAVTQKYADADAYRIKNSRGIVDVGIGQQTFPHKGNKVVYEIASMPQPVYFEIPYKIKIRTEYEQQMNEILAPFMVRPGSGPRVMIQRDGYKYEAFFNRTFERTTNIDEMSNEIRYFETEVGIKVYGYLITADKNEDRPYITIRESYAEMKIPREHRILGDIPGISQNGRFV